MNNVTHATDWRNPRKHVWEIYIRSDFSYPDRIMMSRLLAGVDLYQVWKVSDTKWIGFCKRVSLRRNIRIILDSTDIRVIEKAIGRKLASVEVFEGLDTIDIQPRYFRGLTLHGVATANIGKGMVYRSDFVSIVPYGMFTPVTYAPPQPVISAPLASDDAYRQRLHNETVELTHVVYKPMGRLVKWDAIGMFDGKQVHFKIFPEHARLFVQAGQAPLPRAGSKDIPHIDVVLTWNEHHNDLRMTGVFSSSGKLHYLDTPLPVAAPVPTEDNRTEIQKKLGIGSKYAGFDFGLKPKKAS